MSNRVRKIVSGLLALVIFLALALLLNALFAARIGQVALGPQPASSGATASPSKRTDNIPTPTSEWNSIVVPILDAPLSTSGEAGLAHVDVTAIRVAQTITVPVPCAVKFAPDGRRFACDLEWQGQLWLGSLERGPERQVAEGFPIQWLPDGQGLLFATRLPQARKFDLYFLDLTQDSQQLLAEAIDDDKIDYVPSTREVAFTKQGQLHLLSLETGAERIFSRQMFSDLENFAQSVFRVSPDGKQVAVADLLPQGNSLSILNLESGEETRIADDIASERYPMAWSSNGRYLAYGISPGLEEIPELWVVDADGSNPHKLYVESGEYPRGHFEYFRWLPGGDAIFFIYVPRGLDPYQRAKYEVVSAADGATQVLFSSGGYLELIKEGRFLSFYSAEDERFRSRLAILAYGSEEAQ